MFFDDGYAQYSATNTLHQVYDQSELALIYFCLFTNTAECNNVLSLLVTDHFHVYIAFNIFMYIFRELLSVALQSGTNTLLFQKTFFSYLICFCFNF